MPMQPSPIADTSNRCSERALLHGSSLRAGRCQVVREVGQHLAAVLGHDDQVFEDQWAVFPVRDTGLERNDVADDEGLTAGKAQGRRLVHFEPDAVAERPLESFVLVRLRGALSRIAGRLVQLAGRVEQLATEDAWTDGFLGFRESSTREALHLGEAL